MQSFKEVEENRNYWLKLEESIFLRDCKIDPFQASGPGGQKRNRKYSAIRIVHIPTGYSAVSSETRSQNQNKSDAVRKIKLQIAINIRSSGLSLDRNIVSQENLNYPIWVAMLLDLLENCDYDINKTADSINFSKTKLIKLIFSDKQLSDKFKKEREKRDLPVLYLPK